MAQHDTVVRIAAKYYEDEGYNIKADHLHGYKKPPIFNGPRGGFYRPDIYIPETKTVVEVETYESIRHSIPQIKSFYQDDEQCDELVIILCTGTEKGVERIQNLLERKEICCYVMNYRELPNWPW